MGDLVKTASRLVRLSLRRQAYFLFRRYNGRIMEKSVATLSEFEAEAARFAGQLMPHERATLVTLSGELGAGKTAFAKAIARALGIEEIVTSPTFVLEKIYLLPEEKDFNYGMPKPAFKRLVHIDAYRLEKGSDLNALGFDELIKDAENLILLEWPEIVADALPAPAVAIALVSHPDGSRTISYG